MDEHMMELLGKTKVVVRDGRIVYVSEPRLRYCPLFNRLHGINVDIKGGSNKEPRAQNADFWAIYQGQNN